MPSLRDHGLLMESVNMIAEATLMMNPEISMTKPRSGHMAGIIFAETGPCLLQNAVTLYQLLRITELRIIDYGDLSRSLPMLILNKPFASCNNAYLY
jgi:hypothetical protein